MADLSIPLQGMLRSESSVNNIASQMARLPSLVQQPVNPQDTVNLSSEMVALAENQVIYESDCATAQVLDGMNQSLLSIVG